MKKLRVIVITHGVQDCIDLHNHFGEKDFEKALTRPAREYPTDPKFYAPTWYWWVDGNGYLSGCGGQGALETAVRLSPGSQIYHFKDFINESR